MTPQPAQSPRLSEPDATPPIGEPEARQPEPEVVAPDAESRLDQAQRRLRRAVENLEKSLLRQDRAQNNATALEQELQVLFEDRSKLAHELDLAMTQVSRLESVGAEVSHRLEAVMGSIRTVLTKS